MLFSCICSDIDNVKLILTRSVASVNQWKSLQHTLKDADIDARNVTTKDSFGRGKWYGVWVMTLHVFRDWHHTRKTAQVKNCTGLQFRRNVLAETLILTWCKFHRPTYWVFLSLKSPKSRRHVTAKSVKHEKIIELRTLCTRLINVTCMEYCSPLTCHTSSRSCRDINIMIYPCILLYNVQPPHVARETAWLCVNIQYRK